jgi:hypothetical protein
MLPLGIFFDFFSTSKCQTRRDLVLTYSRLWPQKVGDYHLGRDFVVGVSEVSRTEVSDTCHNKKKPVKELEARQTIRNF